MVDQPQVPEGVNLLPTQQANSFSLAANGNEILLAFGLSRVWMKAAPEGALANHVIEWVATLSISPVAASQLVQILQAGLRAYEQRFGKVPVDPDFKMTQGG